MQAIFQRHVTTTVEQHAAERKREALKILLSPPDRLAKTFGFTLSRGVLMRCLVDSGKFCCFPGSDPSDRISNLADAHFLDTWLLRPGTAPEFTCCQLEDLLNHRSQLYERIDMIFTDYLPRKVKAQLVGNRVADKTRPSDSGRRIMRRLSPNSHSHTVSDHNRLAGSFRRYLTGGAVSLDE